MTLTDAINGADLATEDEPTLLWAINQLQDEVDKRAALANAAQAIEEAQASWRNAAGRTPGDPWVQPTGAHDAYPKNWEATHAGKLWESLINNNVWEPGVSGWREKSSGTVPEFVQPTGAHDAYQAGDLVSFNTMIYKSVIDNNTWSPAAYPAGWEVQP